MKFLDRKKLTEILLLKSLIDETEIEYTPQEINQLINKKLLDLIHDDFYFEFIRLLKIQKDQDNQYPLFFTLKHLEIVDLIHRRLFSYNSDEFFRVVVPIFTEFGEKYDLKYDKVKSQKNENDEITESILQYLTSYVNPYQMNKSKLFTEETDGDTYTDRTKNSMRLFNQFFKMLIENVYSKLGGSIQSFDLIHKQIKSQINDLGYVYFPQLTGEQIDDVFFSLYFTNEMKLLFTVFCKNTLGFSGKPIHKIFFKIYYFQFLKSIEGLKVPEVQNTGLFLPPTLKFMKTVKIVDRDEFFSQLWGIDLSQVKT